MKQPYLWQELIEAILTENGPMAFWRFRHEADYNAKHYMGDRKPRGKPSVQGMPWKKTLDKLVKTGKIKVTPASEPKNNLLELSTKEVA